MQGAQFLYFLQGADGRFAFFRDGQLQWTSTITPIEFLPDTWQEISVLVARNKNYFGLDRTYGVPQNFVNDAAGILKSVFCQYGVEGIVNLTITEQKLYFTDTEYGYYYDLLVRSEIDLTTYVHASEKVTAAILDGEISRLLKANVSTTYEIPLDTEPLVLMDGLVLKQNAKFIVADQQTIDYVQNGNNTMGWIISSQEAKTQLGTQSPIRTTQDENADIFASKQWIVKTTVETEMTFDFDFGMTISLAPGIPPNPLIKYFLSLRVFDTNTGVQFIPPVGDPTYLLYEIDGPTNVYKRNQVTGSKTVKIPANHEVYIESALNTTNSSGGAGGLAVYFVYDTITTGPNASTGGEPNLTISYDYRFKATLAHAITAKKLWESLVLKATDGKYPGRSDLFTDGLFINAAEYNLMSHPFTMYSSGDGLRGLTGAVIKTSISDFFQSLNSTNNLGMGIIENVVRMEPKAFWVTPDPADIILLGEGSKLKVSVATDYLFNKIEIGCANKTYDEALGDINGRYEFNMTHKYSTPMTRGAEKIDIVSKYRRDMYGAEYTRINLDGKTTSDSAADNEIFELHTKHIPFPGGPITIHTPAGDVTFTFPSYYELERSANQYTTGLLDQASAFNVMLSPKHCLYRHGDYIRSVMDKLDNKPIVFTSADKNTPLVTTYPNGVVVAERGNVPVSSLSPQIFKPYIFEDTTIVPDAFILGGLIKKFIFTYQNGTIIISGFAIKTGIQPANDKQQVFQLLCAPDVDLTPTIQIWE